ncbi:MAG: TolC family protein [Bacteroidales bacterium]
MKKTISIITALLFGAIACCQDTINIRQCFISAETNHSLYGQKGLNKEISGYEVANIKKSWFPDVNINGQATYQSDVVGFGTFTAPHDQYKLYLEANQQVYDGGTARMKKEVELTNLEINQQQLEVEFHNVRQQVNMVYFTIAILKKNAEMLSISRSELNEKLKTVKAAIENGALLPESEYVLKAELLKLESQEEELHYKITAAVNSLNELTGLKTSPESEFTVPYGIQINDSVTPRPEAMVFDLRKALVENNIGLLKTVNRPKLYAFAQAGYGKPGLNMLNTEFDYYYIAGLGLKWNLTDWGESRNRIKSGNLQLQVINLNTDNFDRNITIALQNELAKINQYSSALDKDKLLIELRADIKKSASAKLQNGTITATDYITESNEELMARIRYETHIILLVQSIINYQLIRGELIL